MDSNEKKKKIRCFQPRIERIPDKNLRTVLPVVKAKFDLDNLPG
jgi:hypothetical protein